MLTRIPELADVAGSTQDEPRFKQVGSRLSNWGRWGEDDQLGTLNHLTDERVAAAGALVREGRRFELSIPLGKDGPYKTARPTGRVNPIHLMGVLPGDLDIGDGVDVADDFIVMPLQSATQWDGLAHVGYDGRFYNDAPTASMNALNGATRNSIDQTLPGFSGRGVLLDLARFHGREWLEAGHGITPAELSAVEQQQGVTVGPGDAVLVRTGWLHKAGVEGWDGWHEEEPGLTLDCAEWLHERDVCALATDNWAVELLPTPPGDGVYALHCVLIRDMGMMLGEMWNLDALAEDCSSDGRWDFLLVAPALRVTGAVGSPVSPLALK